MVALVALVRVWLSIRSPGTKSWKVQLGSQGSTTYTARHYVWGPQLEKGLYPTSYIPSSIGPATRAADLATIGMSGFLSTRGTIYADFAASSIGTQSIFSLDDSTPNEAIRLVSTDGTTKLEVVDGNAPQASLLLGQLPPAGRSTVAAAFATNDVAVSFNGSSPNGDLSRFTDTSATLPATTRLALGGGRTHLVRVIYWPTRLPNDDLQVLTTLTR